MLCVFHSCLAQTSWVKDWRDSSTEEVIELVRRETKGGWSYAKVIKIFGLPDAAAELDDFQERGAAMVYELKSGYTLRIVRAKGAERQKFPDYYFATFELIDLQDDKGDLVIWTASKCRPLTEPEQEEFLERIRKRDKNNPARDISPSTDFPHSKLNSHKS